MKLVLPNLARKKKNRQKFTCFTVKKIHDFEKTKNFDKNLSKNCKTIKN